MKKVPIKKVLLLIVFLILIIGGIYIYLSPIPTINIVSNCSVTFEYGEEVKYEEIEKCLKMENYETVEYSDFYSDFDKVNTENKGTVLLFGKFNKNTSLEIPYKVQENDKYFQDKNLKEVEDIVGSCLDKTCTKKYTDYSETLLGSIDMTPYIEVTLNEDNTIKEYKSIAKKGDLEITNNTKEITFIDYSLDHPQKLTGGSADGMIKTTYREGNSKRVSMEQGEDIEKLNILIENQNKANNN